MKHLIYMVFAMLMLASCSSDEPGGKAQNINLSRSEQEILDAQKDFSVNFFKSVYASEDAKKNILVSPLSMSMAFSMVANGAEGETLAEITRTLGFSSGELEEVNNLNKTLLKRLPAMDSRITVAIANSIWADKNSSFNPAFSSTVSGNYGAETRSVDLYSESGRKAINDWARSKTNGMIPNVLTSPLNTDFALCNSLYFEGKWTVEFKQDLTRRTSFHNVDGTQTPVYMMYQSVDMEYCFDTENDDWETNTYGRRVVRKSYGNGAYSMTLVLPASSESISELISGIDASTIKNWESHFSTGKVSLGLPRFEYEYGKDDFIAELRALGIVKAFGSNAELSGILDRDVILNKVIQKSRIKVDESGTKAATVTAVGGASSAGPSNEVIFDEPFMYYISEQSTGAILFMGCVNAF